MRYLPKLKKAFRLMQYRVIQISIGVSVAYNFQTLRAKKGAYVEVA
jgi:hypothetical protein